MFYLIWEMGILLLLAVGFGVFVGYQLWSGDARSAEADAAVAENARLRQENENLARRLGEAMSQTRVAAPDPTPARVEAPEIAMPKTVEREAAAATPATPKRKPAAKSAKPKTAAKPAPEKVVAGDTKAAVKSKVSPTPKSAPKPGKPAAEAGDDLGAIKGLGPKAAAALKAGGVTSVAQIAAWSDADIERWDAAINGRGRIERDDWVGQAKKLAG
ncbi:hypothetical protein [Maricaulis sp.]|uniref:hypothetical protein n=1 Tax=Maricaulis sp. TaxID=1486257 RepID=UPI002B270886|nr:hypothetical protein [Maricaulis sp.]